jgi:hypothetical protein
VLCFISAKRPCPSRGNAGSEVQDQDFHLYHARRHSNGKILDLSVFATKFDQNEPEPVFDETLHGPAKEEDEEVEAEPDSAGAELTRTETSMTSTSSVA